jgi:hypothetical protein
MKMEQIECSETSAYKIQTPGNHPEENTTYRTGRKFEIKIKYVFKIVLFWPEGDSSLRSKACAI